MFAKVVVIAVALATAIFLPNFADPGTFTALLIGWAFAYFTAADSIV